MSGRTLSRRPPSGGRRWPPSGPTLCGHWERRREPRGPASSPSSRVGPGRSGSPPGATEVSVLPLSLIARVGLPHLPRWPVGQPGPPSGRPRPRKRSQCLRAPVGRLAPAAVVLGWPSWPGSWSGRSSSGKRPAVPCRGARRTPATGWTVRWPRCRYRAGGRAGGCLGELSFPAVWCSPGLGGALLSTCAVQCVGTSCKGPCLQGAGVSARSVP